MITAILFPACLGACGLFTILAVLEGVDPLLINGASLSGALSIIFGSLYFRKSLQMNRSPRGRFEHARRVLFAMALTGASGSVVYAALDCGPRLARNSTAEGLASKRETIMAELHRVKELEQIVQEQPDNFLRKGELESYQKSIARAEHELKIYESAHVRLSAVAVICIVLGMGGVVAWARAIRELGRCAMSRVNSPQIVAEQPIQTC